jgi:pyridoxal phosphate enzyme (YggS family)
VTGAWDGGIAARLSRVRAGIPAVVRLVAVSKTQPPEAIREAYAAGQRDFGENYVQEWRAKADALADLPDLAWHFVGGLQTNKVKYLAGRVALVHTVDREELGQEIARRWARAGATARVLVEVNVGREDGKAGCAPDDAPGIVEALRALPALEVAGLTCVPPADLDPRPFFAGLRALRDRLGLRELSMGMSADYAVAIEEGATLVRVGTAIFGERAPRGAR